MVVRLRIIEKLNELLFYDTIEPKTCKNVFVKGTTHGGKRNGVSYRAERCGIIVKLNVSSGIKYQVTFHYKRWPSTVYEQEIFLRALLSFVVDGSNDNLRLHFARKAVNEVLGIEQTVKVVGGK